MWQYKFSEITFNLLSQKLKKNNPQTNNVDYKKKMCGLIDCFGFDKS
jgi:hypothetical protein